MRIRPILLLAVATVSLGAQPGPVSSDAGLLQTFTSSYSFSANEPVTRGAWVGEVSVHAFEAGVSGSARPTR